ncbi:hypothetical protein K2173_019300 [Erythroxylum novogranatense]|uniref:Cystatin domain-containing protein n=1 Tax=Erythroxylum novogranatense TaxID=1862640 RepID=A0AAV8ST77_9ROSI|nr:hypothetical protein K2173_019300 [Erythroxylum novogranatense]
MKMASASRTFLLSIVLALVVAVSGYRGRLVGGRTVVRDVAGNEEVQELGRFSVKEFNRGRLGGIIDRGELGELAFSEVVEAERQVVSGIKYYLKIEATGRNRESRLFDSIVVVKPWLKSKELLHFEPSANLRTRKLI